MLRFQTSVISLLILGSVVVANTGCQTWGSKSGSTTWWKNSKEPVPPDAPKNFGEAVKMDIAWKDDVLPGPDGRLQRGVGGRVHFLDKNDKPIRVHGNMTVYGFDEHNGKATSPRPDKRFHFKDEELQNVYSQSSIGHSYNIWLPWDEQGYQRHIAVLPIFRAPDGRLLKGDHAQAVLHGPENPNPISHRQEKRRRFEENQLVERVVYESGDTNSGVRLANGETALEPTQRVRTIHVPDSANAVRKSVENGTLLAVPAARTNQSLPPSSSESANANRPNTATRGGYEVRPYQPEADSSAANSNTSPNSSPASHWDRALDQFNKLGPRKNTGMPGAY
ncbi:MAG: hypothetical protein Q8M16_16110 [Pirellulaceae bacterium]|nr:hypothetical protein [Pirellulaceae bacterium]